MTGGEALVAGLAAHGVDTVFGIPGTHSLPIYPYLRKYRIRHVLTRHEQGAGYAADGYARVSGRPGVVLTTTGPAILNAVAAAAQAYSDSVPVLFVSPAMPVDHPGRGNGLLHEVKDQRAAMAAVTAGSHRVRSVGEIPVAVAQAFADLRTGRPRPRHLDLPLDLLDRSEDVRAVRPIHVAVTPPDGKSIGAAAGILAAARRPGVIVGGGVRHAADELRRLVELLQAPVISSTNGKGILPYDHPLSLGAGLHRAAVRDFVEDCDVVLAIGTELAPADLFYGGLTFSGKLIRVDVDPAQLLTNASPDLSIVADASIALDALSATLQPKGSQRERADSWRRRVGDQARTEGSRWLSIVDGIASAIGRSGVVAADNAMVCYYGALSNLPGYRPGCFLFPTGLGTLGYGLPAAIGAKLAEPDTPVVAIEGDGGLMFSVAELATAAQLRLPLPVVVVDNGGYGEIRREMAERGDPVHAVDLDRPDFPALATALGCHGVSAGGDIGPLVATALAADRPTLIHVRDDAG
ncbi:thiamine pyrophosphate-binding protein [Fodinicola acaciae]|uniref:thiamine pyrophosphate-binding protein n=1 Tax=Fodinicola acaciae TaxID=2681555 RepID=UPI001FE6CBC6|nr:5-guanidino-2-oxopentanoate decarboxylase [Fodinicola acaciae]